MQDPVLSAEARRVYIATPYGHPAVARLKDLGAKWEPETKRWWVGSAKRAAVEAILADAQDAPQAKEDPDQIRLSGKGRYKGRVYYAGVMTRDGSKVRLLTLPDAKGDYLDFWAPCAEVEQVKEYRPREVRNTYGRGTHEEHTTLGSIARFVGRQKELEARGVPACPQCGKRGPLVHDLEDGMHKCYGCCDIPAND